jgi:hypothetical protein
VTAWWSLGRRGYGGMSIHAEAQIAAGRKVSSLGIDRRSMGRHRSVHRSIMAVNAPKFKDEFNGGKAYRTRQPLQYLAHVYGKGRKRKHH